MSTETLTATDIPAKDFRLFKICNNHDGWYKQPFYKFKDQILRKHGTKDHYDLQILERECWSCDGLGYKQYRPSHPRCDSCGGDGVYSRTYILLERWLLNGELFHIPHGRIIQQDIGKTGKTIVNWIKGLIRHKQPAENPHVAYLALLWKYDKSAFLHEVYRELDMSMTRRKHKLRKLLTKCKNQMRAMAEFFGVKESEYPKYEPDDLPF